jgi:hypothetical protein
MLPYADVCATPHILSLGLVSLLQRVDDDDETAEAERERGRRRVLPTHTLPYAAVC